MDGQFKIRSYGYGELALLYFPNSTKKSASVQFRRWIQVNLALKNKLETFGYISGQKLLTPKQVEVIIQFIGEP